ncbi:MAG: hypothetical protein QM718_01100 [Steroidobacteraceae bacterium]
MNDTGPALASTLATEALTALRVSGADARSFLQGQLSCDTRQLGVEQALLGSVNSAQGRVQAVLTLLAWDDDVLLLVPPEMLSTVAARLRPYILRAKVRIDDSAGSWHIRPLQAADAVALGAQADDGPGRVQATPSGRLLRWWGSTSHYLSVQTATATDAPAAAAETDPVQRWHAANIAAGIAQVYRATSGSFVAQMLNLDVLGGISFKKGCYTGQEIIARAHYRGAVKRRMQRYAAATAAPAPGARLMHDATAVGEVVDAVNTAQGCELLAVVSLAALEQTLTLENGTTLQRLPLPYALPIASDPAA